MLEKVYETYTSRKAWDVLESNVEDFKTGSGRKQDTNLRET